MKPYRSHRTSGSGVKKAKHKRRAWLVTIRDSHGRVWFLATRVNSHRFTQNRTRARVFPNLRETETALLHARRLAALGANGSVAPVPVFAHTARPIRLAALGG